MASAAIQPVGDHLLNLGQAPDVRSIRPDHLFYLRSAARPAARRPWVNRDGASAR